MDDNVHFVLMFMIEKTPRIYHASWRKTKHIIVYVNLMYKTYYHVRESISLLMAIDKIRYENYHETFVVGLDIHLTLKKKNH